MTSPPTKPNRLFSLLLELLEEITTNFDYHTLESLAPTNHLARRHLIRKRTLQTALLVLELHDDREKEILSSENLISCYKCLRVLPGVSTYNDGFDANAEEAGLESEWASTRMCAECDERAGRILVRAPKFKRLRKTRMEMLRRRG
jgi:hypothetical protein